MVVEDDLNPRARVRNYSHLLTIREYLQAFFSLYEKSPVTSVFFNRYRVSEVKQDDFTYVEVRYESEFRNRHRAYPEVPYPVRARKATVKAERTASGWQVVIADVSYDRPTAPPKPPAALDPPPTRRVARTTPTTSETNQIPALRPTPVPVPLDTAAVNAPAFRPFGALRATYRSGRTYALPLLPPAIPAEASLQLYQGDQPVEDLSVVLTDSTYTWAVSQQLDAGSGYHFRLLNPTTGATAESAPFAIRKRPRWPWVVGAAAAVVVVAVVSGGNQATPNDELPAPPNPN